MPFDPRLPIGTRPRHGGGGRLLAGGRRLRRLRQPDHHRLTALSERTGQPLRATRLARHRVRRRSALEVGNGHGHDRAGHADEGQHEHAAGQPLRRSLMIATIPATMASTQSSISEVLADLNMTNNPSSGCTNTTAPEIVVAGQEPMAIGLLMSALDRRPSRGRQNVSRPGEHT